MFRYTTTLILTGLFIAVMLVSACGKPETESAVKETSNRDLLVGNWLRQHTTYHYFGKDDRIEQPLDSMWFEFELNGVSIFTQRIQGAYHQQLYSWTVSDSTLTLTSDIRLNTGSFECSISDSMFMYSRDLEEMAQDSLTGWTYSYRRVE